MEKRNYKLKLNAIRATHPQKLEEKMKFYTNKNSLNALFKNKNIKNNIPFKIKKNKFQNKTFFGEKEKEFYPKIQLFNFKKNNNFEPKIRHINSEHFNKIKKIRSSSQEHNNTLIAQRKFMDFYPIKLNRELNKEKTINYDENETENVANINLEEFMEKIKKDFSDIGKLIKMSFIIDDNRKYEYEKNEFVILKIIENDLKLNQGLDIKDFVLNDQKLNRYKSLKDNKIENNSVIKIIL